VGYTKDAEKVKHVHNLPLETPEYVNAKEAGKHARDVSEMFIYIYIYFFLFKCS